MGGYSVGDSVAQFIEEENGTMGMILGIITKVLPDKIEYETEEKDIHIVTIDMYETLL